MLKKCLALRSPAGWKGILNNVLMCRAPEGLLNQIRYDRAVLYEQKGQRARARSEFERIYAVDPSFEDLGVRLGITSSGAHDF